MVGVPTLASVTNSAAAKLTALWKTSAQYLVISTMIYSSCAHASCLFILKYIYLLVFVEGY